MGSEMCIRDSMSTYDLAWLSTATFEQLDAAMKDYTTRRALEPLLKTPQGEVIARKLILENQAKQAANPYNFAWLQKIAAEPNGLEQLKTALKDPSTRAQLDAVLREPRGAKLASEIINGTRQQAEEVVEEQPVTPEEQTQIDADLARANAEEAEAARIAAEEAAKVVTPPAQPTKIVVDYQVTDEKTGQPIGRPTHFEDTTYEAIIEKLKGAHINAVRYAERLKKSQLTAVQSETQQSRAAAQAKQSQQEAEKALEEASVAKDPVKLKDAINKVSKAEREKELADRIAAENGRIIGDAWMKDHAADFVWCEASAKELGLWLKENGKEATYTNLELAYEATKSRLPRPTGQQLEAQLKEAGLLPNVAPTAPVEPVAPAAPIAQPAAATTETITQPAQPTPQTVATASETTSAKATNTPAARRPGVNGGLQPGSLSAQRPQQGATTQTTDSAAFRRSITKMSRVEFRQKYETSAKFREECKANGIVDAAQRQ